MSPEEFERGAGNDRIGTELVLRVDGMKVWHIRLAPGETLAAHRHDRPYFWSAATSGKGRSRYGNGDVVHVEYRAGDTRHFPDLSPENSFVHDLTNVGESELVFVTAEFDR
jgi:uncharacterized RmlC-like cupin family protein